MGDTMDCPEAIDQWDGLESFLPVSWVQVFSPELCPNTEKGAVNFFALHSAASNTPPPPPRPCQPPPPNGCACCGGIRPLSAAGDAGWRITVFLRTFLGTKCIPTPGLSLKKEAPAATPPPKIHGKSQRPATAGKVLWCVWPPGVECSFPCPPPPGVHPRHRLRITCLFCALPSHAPQPVPLHCAPAICSAHPALGPQGGGSDLPGVPPPRRPPLP